MYPSDLYGWSSKVDDRLLNITVPHVYTFLAFNLGMNQSGRMSLKNKTMCCK
jgi:hypothetical protein